MADQGSIDDLLSKEIDQTKVSALVGSLESQLASTAGKESHKTVSGSSFNNNHVGVNAPNIITLARPQQTVVNMQSLGIQPQVIAVNKTVPNSSALINSSVKGSISNPQIIGISSIINANTPNRTNSVNSNIITSLANSVTQPLMAKQLNSNISPSIRIVMNNSKSPYHMSHNPVQVSSALNFNNTVVSQGSTSQPLTKVNICTSGSNNNAAMHSLATIAAGQKPLTVLSNGSTHLQTIQHKDGSVISQQMIMKSDASHTGRDVSVSNSVIQGLSQAMRHSAPLVTSVPQQIIKGDTTPNIVAVRPHTPISQHHVIVRATVATTLANSSPSVQVVSASGTPPIRSALTPHLRPNQVRISNQVRIQHPNLAPRQQTPQTGTLTIPHGALLMRNESGQLVLVSAPQNVLQQTSGSNSVTTTFAPSNCRIQNVRPLSTQAPMRASGNGQTIVTIQPQGTSLQQPIQVRGPTLSTVMSNTNLQQSSGLTTAVRPSQPAISVSHPAPVTVTSGVISASGEMNKAMLENVKKCKNFLSTLIKLAYSQPAETVKNVKALIQGLIDGKVEPEVFTERLQHELQSSPQPYLVPFLKKSLPLLRQSMTKGHMAIEGVKPPPSEVTGHVHPISQPQTPSSATVTQQVMAAAGTLAPRHVMTTTGILAPRSVMATTGTLAPRPVMATTGTLAPRPIMAPTTTLAPRPIMTSQTIGATVQHLQQVRPSPGPASSKVAVVRHPVSQVAIAPGGNKILVHAIPQPVPSQLSHLSQIQSSPRMAVRLPSQAVRTIRPAISSALIKPELPSPAAGYREKRKFESLKDGDDDINDVATMGGVNLFEESKNILATTNADFIGAQSRSCKDEIFLAASPLLKKITTVAKKYGIEDISPAVVNMISHATQERLRDMVSKLSTIAEHRIEVYKVDTRYEVEPETKLKLKFVEELDKLEKKRHEEQEREKLLRAMKSRSKNEDPEQLKLKQKAKELQLAEAEELRQREANQTALAAIGPRKKRKLGLMDSSKTGSGSGSGTLDSSGTSSLTSVMRPRVKRVNMRDVQFLLECEYPTRKSELLYKTFLK